MRSRFTFLEHHGTSSTFTLDGTTPSARWTTVLANAAEFGVVFSSYGAERRALPLRNTMTAWNGEQVVYVGHTDHPLSGSCFNVAGEYTDAGI